MVRIMSKPPDNGNFIMKSMATVWNSRECSGVIGIIAGFNGPRICFVFLTRCTSLDILLDILFHVGPPEVSFCQLISVRNSWVSGGGFVVVKLNYPPLQIVVSGNN